MTTLLVTPEGRCDARCYDAEGDVCTCLCEGRNHGVGRDRALAQTPELVALAEVPMVAMLELPLREGRVCAKCGRPETKEARFRTYAVGLVCFACRQAALVLAEE